MAITIPSKNIYGTPTNNKIIKNKIDNVSVDQKIISPNNEYGVTVFNERESDLSAMLQGVPSDENYETMGFSQTGGGATAITGAMWYAKADSKNIYKNTIYIPILQKNKYVSDLSVGVNKDGEPNIKVNIYGTVRHGTATANWKANYNQSAEGNFDVTIGAISYNQIEESEQNFTIPQKIDKTYSAGAYELNARLDISNIGNLSTATAEKVQIGYADYFKIYIETLCSVRMVSMGGSFVQYYNEFALSGEYETYTPQYIEITVYGNTIGISLEDGLYEYKMGQGNHYSLGGNELMQDSATTLSSSSVRVSVAEHLANIVHSEYKNGKETASIRCSIPTNLSVLNVGDEVIPMVFGVDGVDHPMSRHRDGSEKVFVVVGTKFIYDGAVWQEITIQEKTEEK